MSIHRYKSRVSELSNARYDDWVWRHTCRRLPLPEYKTHLDDTESLTTGTEVDESSPIGWLTNAQKLSSQFDIVLHACTGEPEGEQGN